jgi:hypothetical protein
MAAPAEHIGQLVDGQDQLQRHVLPAEQLAFLRREGRLPEPGLMSVTLRAREYADVRAFALRVPPYQRLYEWSAEWDDADTDVIGLLEDVCEAAHRGYGFHLLNAVVLAVHLEPNAAENSVLRADIIDGQQRTTTLVVIYSVLTACIKARHPALAHAGRSGSGRARTLRDTALTDRRCAQALLARLKACEACAFSAAEQQLAVAARDAWKRFVGAAQGGAGADIEGELFLELLEHSHADDEAGGQDALLRKSVLPLLAAREDVARNWLDNAKQACDRSKQQRVDPLVNAVHHVHLWLADHAGFAPLPAGASAHGTDAAAATQLRTQLAKLGALLRNLDEKLILDVLLVDVRGMTLQQQDRIFSQLNSRGRDMSVADKFKSKLYYSTALATSHAEGGGRADRRVGRNADRLFAWTRTMDSEEMTRVRAQPLQGLLAAPTAVA